jgi:hypothetical protein
LLKGFYNEKTAFEYVEERHDDEWLPDRSGRPKNEDYSG